MLHTRSKGAARLAVGIALGVVLGLSTVGGVAVGQAVYDANNAHKVDGKHAVGAGASSANRAGKLVATNGQGTFPFSAIPKETAFGSDYGTGSQVITTTATTAFPGASATVTMARAGTIEATFAAESSCYGGTAVTWCGINLLVDGTPMNGESDDAFDSNDNANESEFSYEAHSVTRTLAVAAGPHTVTVQTNMFVAAGSGNFRLDDWNLVVEGHM